jgi:hypothetical protein
LLKALASAAGRIMTSGRTIVARVANILGLQ